MPDPHCTHLEHKAVREGGWWTQKSKTLHQDHSKNELQSWLSIAWHAFLGKSFSSMCLSFLVCKTRLRQHQP